MQQKMRAARAWWVAQLSPSRAAVDPAMHPKAPRKEETLRNPRMLIKYWHADCASSRHSGPGERSSGHPARSAARCDGAGPSFNV